MKNIDGNWYVINTLPKYESVVKRVLDERNLKTFLPMYDKVVQWSDRKKKVSTPLFTNYLFVYLRMDQFSHVYGVPGFKKFLSTNGKKDTVSSEEIRAIEFITSSNPEVSSSHFELGQKVKIRRGPLLGYTGKLIQKKSVNRLSVFIKSFSLYVRVDVSPSDIDCVRQN